jgi:hypothetical protein
MLFLNVGIAVKENAEVVAKVASMCHARRNATRNLFAVIGKFS